MINKLKGIVDNLLEEEAKSLLLQILHRIDMLEETAYQGEQFTKDLMKIYKDLLDYKAEQKIALTDYNRVHIVCGDAISGSLKMTLKDIGLQGKEKVISLQDTFSSGPIWKLHEERGLNQRYEWLENHLIFEGEDTEEVKNSFKASLLEIDSIPRSIPIIIWTGENAHEQTGARFVLYLLKEKNNDILLINSTNAFNRQFHHPDNEYSLLHTGEIPHEKLRLIYEENGSIQPLSQKERKKYEEEWEELATKQEMLRIWENGTVCNIAEDYYDDFIINSAKKLHKERENKEFMKSARLIGEVLGHLHDYQYIGDQYLEYRVRHLIMNGVFEIKGVPKAMRFYSVKFSDS